MKAKYKSLRTTIAFIMIAAMVVGFATSLYDIQIANQDYYAAQNNTVKTYTVSIEAARGDIVDRNGNPLVTNRQSKSIILDASYFPSASENVERNAIIENLLALFKKNKEEYVQSLPLKLVNGKVKFFNKKDDEDYEAHIRIMKSEDMFNLQQYATAQNCYDAMVEKYGLEEYDQKTALEIGNIRYELTSNLFSIQNPVVIAEDVKDKTVAAIKEDAEKYLGADVQVVAKREYSDPTIAPHILGTVRKINAEEYAEKKDEGYSITDEIGESGIEASMEKYLRGTPGEKTVTIDSEGNVTEEITKEPVQGMTIVLTIDRDLQKLAQRKLEKICKSVSYLSTGAVVVEDCNSGEVLAAASYPTYNLNDYYKKYSKLAKQRNTPLYNRFAQGTYAPGSTFKPMMASAALQEGVITKDTVIDCSKEYKVAEMTFKCTQYHGGENVKTALRDSCNIFFYNCARKLGINRMNEYGKQFGLGEKTGVEIPEAMGILAGPTYRDKFGLPWYVGDTVQAGIGQSDNLFTPLQLCNYCATVANGGTRYQMHFVKAKISNANGSVDTSEPNILNTVSVSKGNLKIVRQGMRKVALAGGPAEIFRKIDTKVACKTGTSQVVVKGVKHNNGFLITFAPYENPEISVATAIELAGSGTSTAEITSSIIDYYYSHNTNLKTNQATGILLN